MQAYIYIRFSTARQEKGASRDRQLDDCRAMCERRGWSVAEVIEDLGASAWTGAHLAVGNLGRFAKRVRSAEIAPGSVLVVEKLDRLSRQEPRLTQRWMEDMTDLGLSIGTVSGDRVYDAQSLRVDLMETFEILMRAKLAHDESQQKSERVRDRIRRNMEQAKKTGRVLTRKAPGWLVAREDRSGFEIVEERATIVCQIYHMAAEGKGPRWIARELNEKGIPAWGSWRGKKSTPTWETSSVALLLRHPAVEGDYVPGVANLKRLARAAVKERIVGYFPRIVDADLVAKARAAMEARKIGPRGGGRHIRGVANLFAGVAVCAECGNKVHLRSNGDKNPQRHWQCQHAARGRGCSQKAMFRYAPFERAALDAILHLALDDRHFAAPDQAQALSVELASIDKELMDRGEETKRLVKVLARIDDAPEIEEELADIRRRVRELESKRGAAAAALEAARGAVSPTEHLERVREMRGALGDADPDVCRAARLRVQQAIRGLGVQVVCEVDPDTGQREIGMFLPGGMLSLVFDSNGEIVLSWDLMELLEHLHPDLSAPEEFVALATRFAQTPLGIGLPETRWLTTYLRRRHIAEDAVRPQ